MGDCIMLLCSYDNKNVVVVVCVDLTFRRFTTHVCERFDGLTPTSVSLSFKIPGYNNFKMESEADFQSMLSLARSFQLDHIDVDIIVCGASWGVKCGRSLTHGHDDTGGDGGEMVTNIDEEADLLPNFCQHAGNVLLSADWAGGITHIGQCFEGGPTEFRKVLSKYAIECGFPFRFRKNDLVRITAECMFSDSRGCLWSIHARVLNANGFFYLKKWCRDHTCGVAVRTDRNPRMGSEFVADVITERVHDNPLTRPTDVKYDFKKAYGLQISYRVAWLGVEKARGELYSDHSMSFDQLRWYSDAIMEYNPESLFPVAFAIVDSENAVNWAWFLQNLANVVDGDRNLTFVFDRHVGIIESLPTVFPSAHHAFCMQQLQRNLKDKIKYVNKLYRIGLVSKLRECTYAPTVADFNEKIEVFIQSGRHIAVNFLQDLKPYHWANVYFRGNRYGEMCSNAAESFNNWIKEARHLPITRMADAIRTQIMNQMSDRRGASSSWAGVICPKMEYKLEMAYKKGRSWTVNQSNSDMYEVHSHPSVLVDIGRRTCSCFQLLINGLPCEHTVVSIRNSGSDLNALVDPYFHVTNYQSSYSEAIFFIPTVEKP
ncbi:uncharacterized protein LOC114282984 [Camellia sinensis]|uniref:uncharacterized protein LOC114282984 n=1 Tax=Camellia sinensis TaxID=4442 RepID=UPI001036F03E|nr:uncharacterized protein LOC114282984 [Camellia sinensis]